MNLRKALAVFASLMAIVVLAGCSGEPSGRSNATDPAGDGQSKGKAESPEFDPNK